MAAFESGQTSARRHPKPVLEVHQDLRRTQCSQTIAGAKNLGLAVGDAQQTRPLGAQPNRSPARQPPAN